MSVGLVHGWALALVLSAPAGPKGVEGATPLSVELATKVDAADGTGPGIEAWLVSRSSDPLVVLIDASMWNHSALILRDAEGRKIQRYDTRSLRTQAATATMPRPDHYITLRPGERRLLTRSHFSSQSGSWRISWGPYVHFELPAGRYEAEVVWDNQRQDWFDPDTRSRGNSQDAWLGRVSSNRVRVQLD
ncbi:hypothetical protein ACFL6C_13060 [Myxococcota bacterium]